MVNPQETPTPRQLVDAITQKPADFEQFLARNPDFLTMLGKVYPDLTEKSKDKVAAALHTLPPVPVAIPEGVLVSYPDNRPGFSAHPAYLFEVAPSKGTVREELISLLGAEGTRILVEDWGDRCNLNQRLERTEVAIFLDSNNKARNQELASSDAETTQEDDFTATGNRFAENLALTLLCARVLKKVNDVMSLSDGERDLYQKLDKGWIMSCSGALVIDDRGRLRAFDFRGFCHPYFWASCSGRPPELK
jgi:hypothetical protein